MDAFRNYLLGIIGAAMICAVTQHFLTEKNGQSQLIKMICGLVMALSLFSPLIDLDHLGFGLPLYDMKAQAQSAVSNGQQISYDALSRVISDRVEAYILDEARTMGADVSVAVKLSSESIPAPLSVTIQGNLSPFAKNKLQSIIETELGISKENQEWI